MQEFPNLYEDMTNILKTKSKRNAIHVKESVQMAMY